MERGKHFFGANIRCIWMMTLLQVLSGQEVHTGSIHMTSSGLSNGMALDVE